MMSEKSRTEHVKRLAVLLCLGWALMASQCQTCAPTVDVDGSPSGANRLPLNQWRNDQLHCSRGDCADWYRLVVSQRGHVNIEISTTHFDSESSYVMLTLADEHASKIDETGSSGITLKVGSELEPGVFLVRVKTPEGSPSALGYEIVAHFAKWEPPPPPAPKPLPPQFKALGSKVLEYERRPGEPESVLLSLGSDDGLVEDLFGRLLNGDDEIAKIQVVDVYPAGSRARLLESPKAVITPATHAEIDIPVAQPGLANPEVDGKILPGDSKVEITPQIEPSPEPVERPWLEQDPPDRDSTLPWLRPEQ